MSLVLHQQKQMDNFNGKKVQLKQSYKTLDRVISRDLYVKLPVELFSVELENSPQLVCPDE